MNFATARQKASDVLADLDRAPDGASDYERSFDTWRIAGFKEFFNSEESARGFFAVLLTSEYKAADIPPPALIQALQEADEPALSVLTKNLVMSAASEVIHRRNGDEQNTTGSSTVLRRSKRLIISTNSGTLLKLVSEMHDTILGCSERFSAFMDRVNYDEEQKFAAVQALNDVLKTIDS